MTDRHEIAKLVWMLKDAGFEGEEKPLSIHHHYASGSNKLIVCLTSPSVGEAVYVMLTVGDRSKYTHGLGADRVFRLFAQTSVSDTEFLTFGPEPTEGFAPAVTSMSGGGRLFWVCTDPEILGIAEDVKAGVIPGSVLLDWIDDNPEAGTIYPDAADFPRRPPE